MARSQPAELVACARCCIVLIAGMGICLTGCLGQQRIPPPVIAPVPGDGFGDRSAAVPATTGPTGVGQGNATPPQSPQPVTPPLRIGSPGSNSAVPTGGPAPTWKPAPSDPTRDPPGTDSGRPKGESANDLNSARVRAERIFHRLVMTQLQAPAEIKLVVIHQPAPALSCPTANHIVISTGLIHQCTSDGQLAGVLSLPLATLMQRHRPAKPELGRPPPLDLAIGPESSSYGELPPWRQAELVKTGHVLPRPGIGPRPSDPILLARQMVLRAGYTAEEFESGAMVANRAGFQPK